MINLAKALAAQAGLDRQISFEVASALELPFADRTFDRVYCQQALQFFPDKVAALRDVTRVLKPCGQFAAAVWTAAQDGNPIFGAFEKIVARRFGADLIPFGPFSFGDPDALRRDAEQAGLRSIRLIREDMVVTLPDVRTLVLFDFLFLGRPGADGTLQPIVDLHDNASDDLVEAVISDLEAEIAGYIQPDGRIIAPTTTNILIATP